MEPTKILLTIYALLVIQLAQLALEEGILYVSLALFLSTTKQ